MKFKLEIACDNAAFDPDPAREVARILRNLADRCEDHLPARGDFFVLRDACGNKVGHAVLEDE
jgi:hypothetical protein